MDLEIKVIPQVLDENMKRKTGMYTNTYMDMQDDVHHEFYPRIFQSGSGYTWVHGKPAV